MIIMFPTLLSDMIIDDAKMCCSLHCVIIRGAHSTNEKVAALPAAMSSLRFVIFLGTVRDGNFGQRAAKFMVKKLEARGHQTTLLGKGSSYYM